MKMAHLSRTSPNMSSIGEVCNRLGKTFLASIVGNHWANPILSLFFVPARQEYNIAILLILSLAAKDMTFFGIFLIMLCHVTELCSSIRSFANSPCRVSCRTLLFHLSRTSSFIKRLI